MNGRVLIVLVLLLAAWVWWLSPLSPREASVLPETATGLARCPPPPRGAPFAAPLQSPVPRGLGAFRLSAATLQPLAGISIDARVLGREDYRLGRESDLSPTDLALGWGRMRDDDVLSRLDISQSGRWYYYRWQDAPPLPPDEIVRTSANMHMIPADASVARALARVDADQRVRIEGWLVEAQASDGWSWRSSLTRDDSGDGACEVVYVCSLQVL
ncbi:hypothetical protein [Lysobacter humi (ex Lee et al. 2017)]